MLCAVRSDSKETVMIRTNLARAAVAAGIVAVAALGTAGAAFAGPPVGAVLQPGGQVCTPMQFAGHKVRLNGNATGGPVTTTLLKDGVVISSIRASGPVVLGYPTGFPGNGAGIGNYQGCSVNTGTTQTVAQLQLFTDSEVR
jgi:hypothetical protein